LVHTGCNFQKKTYNLNNVGKIEVTRVKGQENVAAVEEVLRG
jgi:hypothetical protein